MRRAVDDARIKVEDVGYVNAHATSTPIGDAIEIKAIKTLFEGHHKSLAVSSTKGAHGHLLGAAGNLETVFTVKAVEEGIFPPTVNLDDVEDDSLNLVPVESQRWSSDKRIALKNAFGFGGTNACLCISQFL
jgi:3-oxoacyl-[acyl-carrier-protein] synthase II